MIVELTLIVCVKAVNPCVPEPVTVNRPTFGDERVCAAYIPLASFDWVSLHPEQRVIAARCARKIGGGEI